MPSTSLGFTYPAGSNQVNVAGDLQTLAGDIDDYAEASVEILRSSGQATLSGDVSVTSTSNSDLTSMALTVPVNATTDVVWVDVDALVLITTAATNNTIEMLVDGVANGKILATSMSGTGRVSAYKKWRLTGLTPGNRAITFRTRNTAGSTGATVSGSQSSSSYQVVPGA